MFTVQIPIIVWRALRINQLSTSDRQNWQLFSVSLTVIRLHHLPVELLPASLHLPPAVKLLSAGPAVLLLLLLLGSVVLLLLLLTGWRWWAPATLRDLRGDFGCCGSHEVSGLK